MKNNVYIIAEAGVNHNGDIDIAREMIDVAKDAGVDAIKFQTFKASNLILKNTAKAEYQIKNMSSKESQYDMLRNLELSSNQFYELKEYCNYVGIDFLSSAFDLESIDLLSDMDINFFKIPSGEITNYFYLKKIAKIKKPIILSTGMSTTNEIYDAIEVLESYGSRDISILHCNTEYPTPMNDVNLNVIKTMKIEFNRSIGYSDHTVGIEVPIAAVALGAEIIEKHFTLNKYMNGPDHIASIEPDELKKMVKSIRNIEVALGNSEKFITNSEEKNRSVARKSLVASRDINIGDMFTEHNLTAKRPGTGLNPMLAEEIIGKKSTKIYKKDEMIENE